MKIKATLFRWRSPKLYAAVYALAKASARSLNNYINQVLEEHVKSKEK